MFMCNFLALKHKECGESPVFYTHTHTHTYKLDRKIYFNLKMATNESSWSFFIWEKDDE